MRSGLCVVALLMAGLVPNLAADLRTAVGDVYVENNRLHVRGDVTKRFLTGSRLVGALYNASPDGRHVLCAGAKVVGGLLLPELSLFVADVLTGEIEEARTELFRRIGRWKFFTCVRESRSRGCERHARNLRFSAATPDQFRKDAARRSANWICLRVE